MENRKHRRFHFRNIVQTILIVLLIWAMFPYVLDFPKEAKAGAVIEDRLFTSTRETVNGVEAYEFLFENEGGFAEAALSDEPETKTVYWGIRAWVVFSNETQKEISSGTPVAQISSDYPETEIYYEERTQTYTPNAKAMEDNAALRIIIYGKSGSGAWQPFLESVDVYETDFITEQIDGVTGLVSSEWTVHYLIIVIRCDGYVIWGIAFGDDLAARIENLAFTKPSPYVKYYFNIGGKLRIDGVLMQNGTEIPYNASSIFRADAIPLNQYYCFQNFTYSYRATYVHTNSWNFTSGNSNSTFWSFFGLTTGIINMGDIFSTDAVNGEIGWEFQNHLFLDVKERHWLFHGNYTYPNFDLWYNTAENSTFLTNPIWEDAICFYDPVSRIATEDFDVAYDYQRDLFHFAAKGDYATNGYGWTYRAGIPQINGTISWIAGWQNISTSEFCYPVFIEIEADGDPWVCYYQRDLGCLVISKSSVHDGTWVTASGFPYIVGGTYFSGSYKLLPLINGDMYFLRTIGNMVNGTLWDGLVWSANETIFSTVGYDYDAISVNNSVYVTAFIPDTIGRHFGYRVRDGDGTWSSVMNISDASYQNPSLVVPMIRYFGLGRFYMIYQNTTSEKMLYSYYNGSVWMPIAFIPTDLYDDWFLMGSSQLAGSVDGKLMYVWEEYNNDLAQGKIRYFIFVEPKEEEEITVITKAWALGEAVVAVLIFSIIFLVVIVVLLRRNR